MSEWSLSYTALGANSSMSQILTVQSADPEAKYSCWKGFSDKHMIASVCVVSENAGASLFLNFFTTFFFYFSLSSYEPRTAIGEQSSVSRFQISISGIKVPTIIRLAF